MAGYQTEDLWGVNPHDKPGMMIYVEQKWQDIKPTLYSKSWCVNHTDYCVTVAWQTEYNFQKNPMYLNKSLAKIIAVSNETPSAHIMLLAGDWVSHLAWYLPGLITILLWLIYWHSNQVYRGDITRQNNEYGSPAPANIRTKIMYEYRCIIVPEKNERCRIRWIWAHF